MKEAACVPRALPLYCRIAVGEAIVHVVTNVYNPCVCRGVPLRKRDGRSIRMDVQKRQYVTSFVSCALFCHHCRQLDGRYFPGNVVPLPAQVQAIEPPWLIGESTSVTLRMLLLALGPSKATSILPPLTSTLDT